MKTLTLPTPRNPQEGALQIRVIERARTLFQDGYTYMNSRERFPEFGVPHLFVVQSPEGHTYLVNTGEGTCDCRFFEEKKYCKHYLAIEKELYDIDLLWEGSDPESYYNR